MKSGLGVEASRFSIELNFLIVEKNSFFLLCRNLRILTFLQATPNKAVVKGHLADLGGFLTVG